MLLYCSCNNNATSLAKKINSNQKSVESLTDKKIFNSINTIPLPKDYLRVKTDSNSFAEWLRDITLKENKTVYLYDGRKKNNQQAQFAVLEISVSNKDLQQCADAVMRLRAEYLFDQKKFNEINFTDNEQTVYSFNLPYTKINFTKYLERVFGMCGSASLSKQLKPVVDFNTIQPGDVLIRGGFPGHAVIIIDVAKNAAGKKIFMLAQSYMPAQDIHILVNPVNEAISPWYEIDEKSKIVTPEYLFYKSELKRW